MMILSAGRIAQLPKTDRRNTSLFHFKKVGKSDNQNQGKLENLGEKHKQDKRKEKARSYLL
jgi:hypothetical protein